MIKNLEEFVSIIPTARGTEFGDIEPFISEAQLWLEGELFGKDLIDKILTNENEQELRTLKSITALNAYVSAIPFLDVVQTVNGFAVVSNANQAPASRERVDKLIGWSTDRMYRHVDRMIEIVMHNNELLTEWKKFSKFGYLTELIFWTGTEYDDFCGSYEQAYKNKRTYSFTELHRNHADILAFQNGVIANHISKRYLDILIENRRNNSLSEVDKVTYEKIKFILGLLMKDEAWKAKEHLRNLVGEMLSYLEKYPHYKDTDEYAAWISERYQNQQDDPTYFFL